MSLYTCPVRNDIAGTLEKNATQVPAISWRLTPARQRGLDQIALPERGDLPQEAVHLPADLARQPPVVDVHHRHQDRVRLEALVVPDLRRAVCDSDNFRVSETAGVALQIEKASRCSTGVNLDRQQHSRVGTCRAHTSRERLGRCHDERSGWCSQL